MYTARTECLHLRVELNQSVLNHECPESADAFILKNQVFSNSRWIVRQSDVAQLNLQESGDQLLSLQDLMCPHLVLW